MNDIGYRVVAALATAQSQEAMRQDAVLKQGVEIVLDESKLLGAPVPASACSM